MRMEQHHKSMPQVSVILPTYNRAYCLQRTIDSVLNQTFPDFELLIIDDASTDNTINLINALTDSRIRLLELSENVGKSAAVNHAARSAMGRWLLFVDSDDRCLPERIEKQLAVAHAPSARAVDGVFARAAFVDDAGQRTHCFPGLERRIAGPATLADALTHNMVGGGTLLLDRRVFLAVGGFDTTLRKSEDREFGIRFLKVFNLVGMEDVVIENLVSPGGMTHTPNPDSLRRILDKHADAYSRIEPRRLATLYREAGEEYLAIDRDADAAHMFLVNLRLHPCARHRKLYSQASRGRWFAPFGTELYGHYRKILAKLAKRVPNKQSTCT